MRVIGWRNTWQPIFASGHRMETEGGHIPLQMFWKVRAKTGLLSEEEVAHFIHCDFCISVWGICLMSHSLEEAERRAKEDDR